jgi:hypothetical protein
MISWTPFLSVAHPNGRVGYDDMSTGWFRIVPHGAKRFILLENNKRVRFQTPTTMTACKELAEKLATPPVAETLAGYDGPINTPDAAIAALGIPPASPPITPTDAENAQLTPPAAVPAPIKPPPPTGGYTGTVTDILGTSTYRDGRRTPEPKVPHKPAPMPAAERHTQRYLFMMGKRFKVIAG